ncbi:hypothetical protein DPMN_116061 [Dreissena polymorpha]|uniref:Uncharacterized protein n=1 Tax=Dreissena polymorpha TaxID=45954 RepID=A0A9D4QT71_DREPO|nr:hypothetical protein DPMN_116061 [Dreissena polymorpha]
MMFSFLSLPLEASVLVRWKLVPYSLDAASWEYNTYFFSKKTPAPPCKLPITNIPHAPEKN